MIESNRKIRLAVLGIGAWATQYHLPALKALQAETAVEITGLWNRTTASAEQAARRFEVRRVYPTLDEVLGDGDIDGYVVLVHSGAVLEVVSRLLARGLPIFAEKPPGGSYRDALALAKLVKVPNVVGFNRRYMPLNRRFSALAREIDQPYFVECHFYRSERHYRRFVLETGVHGINYMEHLCGPIRTVQSTTRKLGKDGAHMWVSMLAFESGMTGLLKCFPRCGSSIERYEVHGADRSVYLHCPNTYTSDRPGKIIVHERGKVASVILGEERPGGELLSYGLLDEYREYLRAVADPSFVTTSNFDNACNTMRIAEAIEAGGGDG